MPTFNLGLQFADPIEIGVDHLSVSHHHAKITIEGDNWVLEDLNSRNGTYVEENGKFRRCDRISIKPETWVRLGAEGKQGYYFKARRVLYPNDYRLDFNELKEKYQELQETKNKLEALRKYRNLVNLLLIVIGLCLSFNPWIPFFSQNPFGIRLCFILPSIFSPMIQDKLSEKLQNKLKNIQNSLVCPKCRRSLNKDDIEYRAHLYCGAY